MALGASGLVITGLGSSAQSNIVSIDTSTGKLYYQNTIPTSSYSATSSYADNFTVAGTLYVTGSTRFGSIISNTHQFTGSVSMTGSLNVVGAGITGSLLGTSSYAITASYAMNGGGGGSGPISVTGSTLYSNSPTSSVPRPAVANYSIFLGLNAASGALSASNSNFLGYSAGRGAVNANDSNFIGLFAGYNATNANYSNFLGNSAGYNANGADNSNFFGVSAGGEANNAFNSNFFGFQAGYGAGSAYHSNFIGDNAGASANNASYSTLIGFNVGVSTKDGSIGSNNIIIGNRITVASGQSNSINIGGLIFGTGSYEDINQNHEIYSGSANGKIGINQPMPTYELDVSGSVNFTGDLYQYGSPFTASYATTASYVMNTSTTAASIAEINSGSGANTVTPANQELSKYTSVNIYNFNNFS